MSDVAKSKAVACRGHGCGAHGDLVFAVLTRDNASLMNEPVASHGLPAYGERYLEMPDGLQLMVMRFTVPGRRRTILFVHGCGEYGSRYRHVAEYLAQVGWNVVSVDLRGHGRSAGTPTHVRDFDEYVDDLDTVCRACELVPQETIVMGHSMGGLVGIRFAQTRPDRLRALVACSPMLRLSVSVSRWTLFAGWIMSRLAPKTRFRSRVPAEDTTRCPDVIARRSREPLLRRSVTAGCFFAMRRAMRAAWDGASRLRPPVLVLQAGQDRIADPTAVVEWVQRLEGADKALMMRAEGYHELLNDPDWRNTVDLATQWLEAQLADETAELCG